MLTLKESTMLGDVPDDWDIKPLKAVLSDQMPGDWGDESGPNMFSVLRSTNLTNERRLDFSDVASRALDREKVERLTPKKGDILLERSGGGPDQPVGRVGVVPEDLPGFAFSNFLHLLRPDADQIDASFLSWVLFRINRTRRVLRLEQQTTQMRNLNFRDYLTMPLPVPSADEQAAIARVLDAVDTAIAKARAFANESQRFERAVIASEFQRLPGMDQRLRDFITDVRYGTSVAASGRGWGNPVLRIPNVVGNRLTLNDLAYVELPEIEVDRLQLRDGDLLLVRTNGNPSYVGRSVVFNAPDDRTWVYASYLIRVRLSAELLPDYVNIFLGTEQGRRELLRRVTTSAGNNNINANNIKLVSIPVPRTQKEQERIVELARACRERTDALERKLVALHKLKKSLMQDLLSGTKRIDPALFPQLLKE
ncbi:restriction endonuclease subunit S [Thiohalocapsa sp. ML1]|jgi:type I restriction enzyme, S subunit|uniref:restriction endonuclease subunit S n=1 Tax=Thiohalocapsa sp. ML1 TaxID=1431688 RepID=UPI0007320502|nr:restriction endonuclease subunit S [Thiohalocapsa sp. ML1]